MYIYIYIYIYIHIWYVQFPVYVFCVIVSICCACVFTVYVVSCSFLFFMLVHAMFCQFRFCYCTFSSGLAYVSFVCWSCILLVGFLLLYLCVVGMCFYARLCVPFLSCMLFCVCQCVSHVLVLLFSFVVCSLFIVFPDMICVLLFIVCYVFLLVSVFAYCCVCYVCLLCYVMCVCCMCVHVFDCMLFYVRFCSFLLVCLVLFSFMVASSASSALFCYCLCVVSVCVFGVILCLRVCFCVLLYFLVCTI